MDLLSVNRRERQLIAYYSVFQAKCDACAQVDLLTARQYSDQKISRLYIEISSDRVCWHSNTIVKLLPSEVFLVELFALYMLTMLMPYNYSYKENVMLLLRPGCFFSKVYARAAYFWSSFLGLNGQIATFFPASIPIKQSYGPFANAIQPSAGGSAREQKLWSATKYKTGKRFFLHHTELQ